MTFDCQPDLLFVCSCAKCSKNIMGFVYILTNKPRGVLYIGVTNDIVRRAYEHKFSKIPGFTRRYNCHRLVYYEVYDGIIEAIAREKQLKLWSRSWKLELIERQNPEWVDQYEAVLELWA